MPTKITNILPHENYPLYAYKIITETVSLIIINIAVAEKSISQIMNVTEIDYVNSDTYYFLFCFVKGDARTQSPTTKNCAPEFPTFGEIASFNLAKCNAQVST